MVWLMSFCLLAFVRCLRYICFGWVFSVHLFCSWVKEIMLRMQWIELPRKWFYWNDAVSPLIHLKFEIQYETEQKALTKLNAQYTLHPAQLSEKVEARFFFSAFFFSLARNIMVANGNSTKGTIGGFSIQHRPLIFD